MKERPIIFNGPMVRAILDGRKTQTRRVMKPQPPNHTFSRVHKWDVRCIDVSESPNYGNYWVICPHGQPGDTLWVRETWGAHPFLNKVKPSRLPKNSTLWYRADDDINDSHFSWRPSIFLPRWASRITLEIVRIRVERIQEISQMDCVREGIQIPVGKYLIGAMATEYVTEYQLLWDSLNAKRGYGWDVNPWVWVIEFKKL